MLPNTHKTAATALAGKSVLVVEDNGLLCCVLEQTLGEAGCSVVGPYGRLQEALDAVPRAHIDVALLDINLRGEIVSPLAEQLRQRGIPFLLTSAYQARDLPIALRSEVQLRKPYTDDDLLDGLAALLEDGRRNN